MKKQDPTVCCLQESHLKYKDTLKLKVEERRKACLANTNQKKVEVAILISNRADFWARKMIRVKEGHFIILKGPVLHEDNNPLLLIWQSIKIH